MYRSGLVHTELTSMQVQETHFHLYCMLFLTTSFSQLIVSQLQNHMYLPELIVLPHTGLGVIWAHGKKYDALWKLCWDQNGLSFIQHLASNIFVTCPKGT